MKKKESKNKKNLLPDQKILIGDKLKDIRKELGLTQEEVAESLGLASRYISDIERNKTKGSLTTLIKLCNLYKVSPTVVLKEYLISNEADADNGIVGFHNLSDNEKLIVEKLVKFMNQNHKKKKSSKSAKTVDSSKSNEQIKADDTTTSS